MNYEIICYICYRYSKIYDDICSKNVYIYTYICTHTDTFILHQEYDIHTMMDSDPNQHAP